MTAALPLPWLAAPLAQALASQRGHAVLVQGAPGVGALEFGLALAQAWLCEARAPAAAAQVACGQCGSCRLFSSHLHPDLFVLLPEVLRRSQAWPLADDKGEGDDSKRKPSRQIRIEEVRGLIDWSHKTSARGRGKVALLHPADAMNLQSASALLKTLEEPPLGTRLVLTTADAAGLLPTVQSRCQRVPLPLPVAAAAETWLAEQGVADPAVLLAACQGRPLDALALSRSGVDATAWAALPRAVAHGQAAVLAGWPVPQAVDALQKLCHDAMARAVGGAACYFPEEAVPAHANLSALATWANELARVARHADHPWNEGLVIDSMVQLGSQALAKQVQPAGGLGFVTLGR